jgi:class 3 adenylate cyclase
VVVAWRRGVRSVVEKQRAFRRIGVRLGEHVGHVVVGKVGAQNQDMRLSAKPVGLSRIAARLPGRDV